MATRSISRTTIVAIVVATVAALVARAWLQLQLLARGMAPQTAADVSYLSVPLVMAMLLLPLWRNERAYLLSQFRLTVLSPRLVLTAILIGVLLRLLWWGQLVFGISFGIYASVDSSAVVGPVFSFQCPSPELVALNILVMSVLAPVIEEIADRGYILAALGNRGMLQAVLISALVFAISHELVSLPFAFFAGIIFGVQYWKSGSLWPSIISHFTVNTLILLDWHCLSGHWNPRTTDIPLWLPGVLSSLVVLGCGIALYALLRKSATEA